MNEVLLNLPAAELAAALREGARGYYPAEAGVELLIWHRTWLQRRDFRAYVEYCDDVAAAVGREPMAFMVWEDAAAACPGALPCSSGEASVLRLAASLAEGFPVSLREAVTGLDTENITAVVRALLWANGRTDATVRLDSGEGVGR